MKSTKGIANLSHTCNELLASENEMIFLFGFVLYYFKETSMLLIELGSCLGE